MAQHGNQIENILPQAKLHVIAQFGNGQQPPRVSAAETTSSRLDFASARRCGRFQPNLKSIIVLVGERPREPGCFCSPFARQQSRPTEQHFAQCACRQHIFVGQVFARAGAHEAVFGG